jgi:hypothetical protein
VGNPGYRELAKRSGYSAATLANAAAGRQLPTLAVTLAFVRACDGQPVDWERRWRQAAAESRAARSGNSDGDSDGDAGTHTADAPPYRGLAPFDVVDADCFFGRGRIVDQLVQMLDQQRFLAVFGVSGSGKSSLLRAGLVPAFPQRVAGPGGCPAIVITPGVRPVAALREALQRMASGHEGLLVVDQFEEVFTHCADARERTRFVDEVAAVAKQPDIATRVVIGVRADFYARCTSGDGTPVVLQGHPGLVWRVAFAPDGRTLVTGGDDGNIRIWNSDGQGQPLVLSGHHGPVWSVAFSPDGRQIVSSGHDGSQRVWQLADAKELVVFRGHGAFVEHVIFAPNGRDLIAAHGDGTIRLSQCEVCGPISEVRALADTRVTRPMTPDERRTYLH